MNGTWVPYSGWMPLLTRPWMGLYLFGVRVFAVPYRQGIAWFREIEVRKRTLSTIDYRVWQ